ncbi:AAA family ATPase [Pectobacterium versatile]|uniref:AAA family ATPase n=1 Tax=Pectobacterium versatile TaxID=2488639 RepID=UPI001F1C0677|nr:DUF3696 domain-containing protein [Pectobacterium versatile]
MLNKLLLKSFKSFTNLNLSLRNMTILTGLNSSGKSSVLQAIRMANLARKNLSPYIQGYGNFTDLKSKLTSPHRNIYISLTDEDSKEYISLYLKSGVIKCRKSLEKICFDYISADRLGPCVTLPIMGPEIDEITIGEKGEFTADYYSKFENVIISELLRHPNSSGNTLKHQLNHWMGEISPGVDIFFTVNEEHDISHLDVNGFRATNTGFGISYSLPIILSALVMASHPPLDNFKSPKIRSWHSCSKKVLVIENPEAHLHPKGQTALGYLLTLVSSCGTQIIVETHSDHFIDGVRLAVKKMNSSDFSENCIIHYFTKERDKGTSNEDIYIKNNGKLTSWPVGFFDQNNINLSQLARIQ